MNRLIRQMGPTYDLADQIAVQKVVDSGWTSEGALTKEFEQKVARVMGYKFGVACCNGTVALTLGLKALDWRPEDLITMPDFTFVATAEAVSSVGAKPTFEYVREDDFCVAGVLLSVALNGRSPRGYHDIQDSAQALGSMTSRAFIATLSFAPNKIITTAQGGMVLTDNKDIMEKVRRLKDHGRLDKADYHPSIGFDYKFSDLQAALGLSQLEKLPVRIAHKRRICQMYQEELKGVKDLTVCGSEKGELLWNQDVLTKHRDLLQARLLKSGVETRAFYKPLHEQPAYRTEGSFPIAERISAQGLWLPSSSDLTEKDVMLVCQKVKEALR